MDANWVRGLAELIAVGMLPIGFVGFMWHRIVTKKAIGARAIQFTAVIMLMPVILILALEKILDGTSIGTLIGGITG